MVWQGVSSYLMDYSSISTDWVILPSNRISHPSWVLPLWELLQHTVSQGLTLPNLLIMGATTIIMGPTTICSAKAPFYQENTGRRGEQLSLNTYIEV